MRKRNVLLISIALVVISLGIVLYFKVFYLLDEPTFASPMEVITLLGMMPLVLFGIIEVVVAIIIVIVSGKDLNWAHVKSG